MKKNVMVRLMICVLIILFSSHLIALEGGFKIGLNKVNFTFSNNDLKARFSSSSEFISGVFFSFNIAKSLKIQPEMYYSTGSMSAVAMQLGHDIYKYTYKISYFDIPLLLTYKIQVRRKVSLGIFFGPFIGIRGKAKFLRTIDHGEEEQFGEREDIKKYIKNIDYGLVLGGSLERKFCFGKLILDIRYSRGFVNILKDKAALSDLYVENCIFLNSQLSEMFAANDTINNKAFIIMIGLGF
jgi:hypothetical protein